MDINRLFKSAEMSVGRVLKILPEAEIGSAKQYLQEILEYKTLPALNELYPHVKRVSLNKMVRDDNIQDPLYIAFRVPSEATNGLKIMSVRALYAGIGGSAADNPYYDSSAAARLGRGFRLAAYPNKYGRYSSANLYESALLAGVTYADNQLLGQLQEAPIPRFRPPNIILINKAYMTASSFTMVLCLENDKSLITIPENIFEGVRRLFVLDIKMTIWNQYGMLSNIDTALGTLDLKIDDWSGAESERQELFDTYKSQAHMRTHGIWAG